MKTDNYGIVVKKKTMRVNGHVLTEKYVKQYKWECIVKSNIDLGNGDHVLITFFTSLWQERPLEDQETKPLDLDHYEMLEPRELLWTWSKAIYKIETQSQWPTETSMSISKIPYSTIKNMLPRLFNQNRWTKYRTMIKNLTGF